MRAQAAITAAKRFGQPRHDFPTFHASARFKSSINGRKTLSAMSSEKLSVRKAQSSYPDSRPLLRSSYSIKNASYSSQASIQTNIDAFIRRGEISGYIKQPADWYLLSPLQLKQLDQDNIIGSQFGHICDLLRVAIPQHRWLPWKFAIKYPSYWPDARNQMFFMNWAAEQLGVSSHDDWYRISSKQLKALGGSALLQMHQNSLQRTLRAVFPEHDWLPWKFVSAPVPKSFWSDPVNLRRYFEWLAKEEGHTSLEDWYHVSTSQIEANYGGGVISRSQGRTLRAQLMLAFPEHTWDENRFGKKHIGTEYNKFNSSKVGTLLNRSELGQIGQASSIHNLTDWYQSLTSIKSHPIEVVVLSLVAAFPEHDWQLWRFPCPVPRGYWSSKPNRRNYLLWLCQTIRPHLSSQDALYGLSAKDLQQNGGAGLAQAYNGKLTRLVIETFDELKWETWKFSSLPKNYWDTISDAELHSVLGHISSLLHLPKENLSAWYNVSVKHRNQALGKNVSRLSSERFADLLIRAFPHHAWDRERLVSPHKLASQARLRYAVETVLSQRGSKFRVQNSVVEGYKFNAPTGESYEIDIFIPELRLGFEYQGQQHYQDTFQSMQATKQKDTDSQKAAKCADAGITLIEVSYSWDGSLSAVNALIAAKFTGVS